MPTSDPDKQEHASEGSERPADSEANTSDDPGSHSRSNPEPDALVDPPVSKKKAAPGTPPPKLFWKPTPGIPR
jgi:hypothetical protein